MQFFCFIPSHIGLGQVREFHAEDSLVLLMDIVYERIFIVILNIVPVGLIFQVVALSVVSFDQYSLDHLRV